VDGDGAIWSVVSVGYVYKRFDHTFTGAFQDGVCPQWSVKYNQSPNQVLTHVTITSEFRKLSLNFPGATTLTSPPDVSGAIYVDSVTQVSLTNAQTGINAAVSATGNYPVVGMNYAP